jgi:hypothetical protein
LVIILNLFLTKWETKVNWINEGCFWENIVSKSVCFYNQENDFFKN